VTNASSDVDVSDMIVACLYVYSLPKCVRRRIKALKKLQAEHNKIESEFFEEVHHLECKYAAMYDPFFQKVSIVIIANALVGKEAFVKTLSVHFYDYEHSLVQQ